MLDAGGLQTGVRQAGHAIHGIGVIVKELYIPLGNLHIEPPGYLAVLYLVANLGTEVVAIICGAEDVITAALDNARITTERKIDAQHVAFFILGQGNAVRGHLPFRSGPFHFQIVGSGLFGKEDENDISGFPARFDSLGGAVIGKAGTQVKHNLIGGLGKVGFLVAGKKSGNCAHQ